MRRLVAGLVAIGALAPLGAHAHEFTPGLLEIEAEAPDTWRVAWQAPRPAPASPVGPAFAEACAVTPIVADRAWRVRCAPEALTVEVRGLDVTGAEVLVVARAAGADGLARVPVLTAAAPTWRPVVAAPLGAGAVFADYLVIGVEHILLGPDHLAFVMGLLLLVGGAAQARLRRLVAVLTAFTVAHSVTLVGAALGWVHLPSAPVEAVIALSIVFVAREAVLAGRRGRGDARASVPLVAAFGFGLLHGFGFAGALSDLGLPEGQLGPALLGFNLGVEAGQIAVVLVAVGLGAVVARVAPGARRPGRAVIGHGLGVVAALWTLERLMEIV